MGRTLVVILNWNRLQLTTDCVRSFVASGVPEADLLVVDNGSTDGSVPALRDAFPHARVLALPKNLGFTGGMNAGIDVALRDGETDFVLLQNNDTLATPGLVAALERALDAEPQAAAAQPKIVYFDRETVENVGFEMDKLGVTWPRGRGASVKTRFADEGYFYPSGACVLVRAAALREVGAFDDAYFAYNEDVDLAWRLRVAGWSMRYVDDAVCYHGESMTASRDETKIGVIWRNRFRTLLKNCSLGRALWTVPAAFALTAVVAAGVSVLQRRPVFLWLYLKAVGWNLARLPSTLRERARVQALRKARDRDVARHMAKGSIEVRMMRARRRRSRA